MTKVVDASVVLAHLLGEPGGVWMERDGGPFVLSTTNYADVLSKVAKRDGREGDVERVLRRLPVEIAPVGREDALRVGRLRSVTRAFGLSLGDRICLALAQRLAAPVATAERRWARLDIGVDVRLIR